MKLGDQVVSDKAIAALCRRWRIRRLYLFGSARQGRLAPESDVDLLVDFESEERWSLMDLAEAEAEFEALFSRKVDLVDRANLERSGNALRRDAILNSSELLYAA